MMGWGIQVHSITAAPAAAAPKLKRVLGLWDLVYYGVILTSPIAVVPMFGYFQNAAKTLRQGVEAKLTFKRDRWNAYANYTFIDATYQSPLTLQSPNNPASDPATGNIFVVPGDRIPPPPAFRPISPRPGSATTPASRRSASTGTRTSHRSSTTPSTREA